MQVKNGALLFVNACQEVVGGDPDGNEVTRTTALGVAAKALGLEISYSGLGYDRSVTTLYEAQKKYDNPATQRQIDAKVMVVAFLREWADAIEEGR